MFSLSKNSIAIRNIVGLLYLFTFLLILLFPNNLIGLSFEDGGYDEVGFQAERTYINYSPVEFVNPYSGNLTLVHKDIVLPGNGGLDLEITRVYNSKQFYIPTLGQWRQLLIGEHGIGWDVLFARIILWAEEPYLPKAALTMSDGSIFQIFENNNSNINTHTNAAYIADNFATLDFDQPNDIWTMTLPNGTVYTHDQQIADVLGGSETHLPTLIKDTNGNEINIEYYDCCNIQVDQNNNIFGTLGSCPTDPSSFRKSEYIKQITDSVGRAITFNWINNSCRSDIEANVISSIDVNGKLYNYIYDEVFDVDTGKKNFLLRYANPPVGPGWEYIYESNGSFVELEMETVVFPSGGSVDYAFTTITHNISDIVSHLQTKMPFFSRMLVARSTMGPNVTPGTWVFSYGYETNINRTVVTDPCGNKVAYQFHGAHPASHICDWAITLLDDLEILDPLDNVVQLTDNVWSGYEMSTNLNRVDAGFFYSLLDSKTITRDSNTYTNIFTYNTFYASPTQMVETGEISRTTDITYFENLAGGSYIIDLPQSTTVTFGTETKILPILMIPRVTLYRLINMV